MPRSSLDRNVLNQNGNLLLDFCKQSSMRIVNGRCGDDIGVGNYTCTTSRGQSLVDYFIVSPKLIHSIASFNVGEPNILSDHSILSLILNSNIDNVSTNLLQEDNRNTCNSDSYRYTWNAELVGDYVSNLNNAETIGQLEQLVAGLETYDAVNHAADNNNCSYIDDRLSTFTSILEKCAAPLKRDIRGNDHAQHREHFVPYHSSPWFDDNCAENVIHFMIC